MTDEPVRGPGSCGGHGRHRQRDALVYLQVRALNGGYRDDLGALRDCLGVLARRAGHPGLDAVRAEQAELALYTSMRPARHEPQQSWQRRRDQQWYAVLCELDEFLQRHADDQRSSEPVRCEPRDTGCTGCPGD